jgi:CRP/FNR family cyclic AMP-dependent transcriptional regulator
MTDLLPRSQDRRLADGASLVEKEAALRTCVVFARCSPGAVAELAAGSTVAAHSTGTDLFRAGYPSRAMYVVLSGKVKLTETRSTGHSVVLELVGPGDHLGEAALVTGDAHACTATVVGQMAVVIRIPTVVVTRWLCDHPADALRLLSGVARRLDAVTAVVYETQWLDVTSRLANTLLALARRFGNRVDIGILVRHDLTQSELAQLTGTTRETVNKTLAEFDARGWIRQGSRSVVVMEPRALQRLAGVSESGDTR